MSLLVLSDVDVREVLDMESCVGAMEDALAALARDELSMPLRFVVRPPGEQLLGLMPAHRAGPEPLFSLQEIVGAPANGARGLDPQRIRNHRDPHGRRLGRRDEAARAAGLAPRGDPRRRCPGALARARDADRDRRPGAPDLEPDAGARRGARARIACRRVRDDRGGPTDSYGGSWRAPTHVRPAARQSEKLGTPAKRHSRATRDTRSPRPEPWGRAVWRAPPPSTGGRSGRVTSPNRREPRQPTPHLLLITVVCSAKAPLECRLLVTNHEEVRGQEPDSPIHQQPA